MEKPTVSLADLIWVFIGVVSFSALMCITATMGFISVFWAYGYKKLLFFPITFVLWALWAGVVMAVKHKRSRM